MKETFITNSPDDLEVALGELEREEKSNGEFLESLMRSKAFTLLDRPWGGDVAGSHDVRLVTVEDEGDDDGKSRMLGLFTSPEKAQAIRAQAPDFQHVARVDVLWAFLHLESGCGVMVNPGQETSFRIPPEAAASLKQSVMKALDR